MLKIKLIFFILLTMSLGFHAPLPEASAAAGDITPIRIKNHAAFESASDNFEFDTEKGTYTTQGFVQVDSDTYALAYMGPGDVGFLSTFTISSDGTTITEVDNVQHETNTMSLGFSLVQVDSDTYALAYGGTGSDGFISTFDIDSDGIITPIRI